MADHETTSHLFTGLPLLAVAAAIGLSTTFNSAPAFSASPSAVPPPAVVRAGQAAPLAVAITSTRTVGNEFVAFSVYSAAGRLVWRAWRSPLTFMGAAVRTVAIRWSVPATLVPGRYTVRYSLYAATGEAQHLANNTDLTLTVQR